MISKKELALVLIWFLRMEKCYSCQALAEAGVELLFQVLRARKSAHYGRPTARDPGGLSQTEREQWAGNCRTIG
jgi:hypothetical protein